MLYRRTPLASTQTDGIQLKLSDGEDDTLKVTVTSSDKTLVPESSANIIFNNIGQTTTLAAADYKDKSLPLTIKPAAGPVFAFGHVIYPFRQADGFLPGGNILESGIGHGMLSFP